MPGSDQSPGLEALSIRPAAGEWSGLVRPRDAADPVPSRFREQLGLPTDRPIIMTGHQAAFWHPGILAKYLATAAASRSMGGSPAWVVVDQEDPPAETLVRFPAVEPTGQLGRGTWNVAAGGIPPRAGIEFVDSGLARIRAAWAGQAEAATPARRVASALADLMSPLIQPAPVVFVTELFRTDLFTGIVDVMARTPEACGRAYNDAARRHPSSGIRPLVSDAVQDRYELPLWRLSPGGGRRRVYAEDLRAIPPNQLAPRALLMTAMMRCAGCELFIHGTGGGGGSEREGYDRVMEDWLGFWRTADPVAAGLLASPPAPAVVVTATRLLPLRRGPASSVEAASRAAWAAHRARHDPAMLGDGRSAAIKADLLARIADTPRHDHARRELFDRLHRLLDGVRAERAGEIARLDAEAEDARARASELDILLDRTWPFPLYPDGMLAGLRDEINAAFRVVR